MFERFAGEARKVVVGAVRVAARSGEATVTPEHLLLALAEAPTTPAGRALASVGLDGSAVEMAIVRDRSALLASVGVTISDEPPRSPSARARPSFAPATKRALDQALEAARERGNRNIGSGHLLLGLVNGDHTRILRLLSAEGVDVDDLLSRLDPAPAA